MHNMHDKQFIHFYVAKSALLQFPAVHCTQLCWNCSASALALLKVLQADGASTVARSAVGTGAGASQSKQSAAAAAAAAAAGAPTPRRARVY